MMNARPLPLEELEMRIAKFLRAGVVLAGLLLAVGWLWQTFSGEPGFLTLGEYQTVSLVTAVRDAFTGGHWGLITSYLGLFVLISLPLIRVLMTAVLLLREKDYILSTAALAVFLVIIASALLGLEL